MEVTGYASAPQQEYTLFDKLIDITLQKGFLPSPDDLKFTTPVTGVKPTILIKGTFLPSLVIASFEVRVTNFYPGGDLSKYSYMTIKAGYATGLSLVATCFIFEPFVEKPSPDGIIVFKSVLADYQVISNAMLYKKWPSGTMLTSVFNDLAVAFGCTLQYSADASLYLQEPLICTRNPKTVLPTIKEMFPDLTIIIDSQLLIVCETAQGRPTTRYTLDKISSAVKSGTTLTVVAPWIPTLRCMDVVLVNASFYKQSLGSSLLAFTSNEFIVLTIDFAFGTNDTNSMILTLQNKGQQNAQ